MSDKFYLCKTEIERIRRKLRPKPGFYQPKAIKSLWHFFTTLKFNKKILKNQNAGIIPDLFVYAKNLPAKIFADAAGDRIII